MDLIIRNAKLGQREGLVDLGIKGEIFAEIERKINKTAKKEIDAEGNLLAPPFVESHVHLDSALNAGKPRDNKSGTLLEAIEIWGERRESLTKKLIKENARTTIKWLIANGVLRIRTHADTSEKNLMTLEALLEVREEMKEYVDIQIVAFPQDGIFAYESMEDLMVKAIKMGADVVGALPQVELTREEGIRSIDLAFDLAKKYNKLVDIHTDETTDEHSRFLEVIVDRTIKSKMEGLVTASHCTAMHSYNNDYAAKLIANVKRSEVNIVTNPSSNALLQNRLDGYPRARGHTRVDHLLENNINVSIGNDNIMDPFGPLGKGSMLQMANLLAHTAHLSGSENMIDLFDMISINGAQTLNDKDYGIEIGKQADFIILDARNEMEAIRLISDCLYVVRKGRVISKSLPVRREVIINNFKENIDFKI